MDTTTKANSQIRDRLAQLARERGTTIRDPVAKLAEATPIEEEMDASAGAATAYVRDRINPDLSDADLAAGETFWAEIEAGRLPNVADLYLTDGNQAA